MRMDRGIEYSLRILAKEYRRSICKGSSSDFIAWIALVPENWEGRAWGWPSSSIWRGRMGAKCRLNPDWGKEVVLRLNYRESNPPNDHLKIKFSPQRKSPAFPTFLTVLTASSAFVAKRFC